MKTNLHLKSFAILLFVANNIVCFAQLAVPFKIRYQSFVKGNMTVIANNIVNRKDYNNGTQIPYYNHTNSALLNDEFNMEYIDIDDDDETFSSSSAELFLDNQHPKKILYAGLYWAATYKYTSGIERKEGKFEPTDATRENFKEIKIKFPNQEKYTDITGQIIFDGLNNKELKEFSPYVVYADVTNYLNNFSTVTGVYTVANIKATQGTISGGVAGGWTLFIVYQDDSLSSKYITSFDGFAGASNNATDVTFSGFQALPEGNVKAKIACASLEGDSNLIGDQLLFKSSENKNFTPLTNSIRKADNFFDSSITIENKNFPNRFPDSKNTLGYDTCLMTIPNPNNTIISNNNKESTLRISSNGDRYFMFFSAFEIEVANPDGTYEITTEKPIASNTLSHKSTNTILNTDIKFVPANSLLIADSQKNIATLTYENKEQQLASKSKQKIEIQVLNTNSQPKGYYLVANVFLDKNNALIFENLLISKGFNAKSFLNPMTKYTYVYLDKLDSEQDAVALYLSQLNDTYKEKIWILSVNKNTLTLTDNDN
ncbi:MAG: hypothetical protein H7239_08560 [Flavobacterium sp.]|nr:hypothetical protein [Flavobacterium sp.]